MPTIQQICNEVRTLCDDPLPQKPSPRRVLLAVIQSLQTFYSRLENTGQAWSIKPDYTLTVAPNTADYLLAIDGSYGKPVQVISLYPANPSYIPRLIEFREFGDMYFDWGLPQNIASWIWNDGSNCTALRMAFYYKDDGTRWVRILPQPMLTASYAISFASGDWASNAALEDSPVLSQFHALVETWAAQSVLPSCQWGADQKYNMEHRKELAISLENDRRRIAEEFDRYVRNTVDDHMTTRASSMDGDDGVLYGTWY